MRPPGDAPGRRRQAKCHHREDEGVDQPTEFFRALTEDLLLLHPEADKTAEEDGGGHARQCAGQVTSELPSMSMRPTRKQMAMSATSASITGQW